MCFVAELRTSGVCDRIHRRLKSLSAPAIFAVVVVRTIAWPPHHLRHGKTAVPCTYVVGRVGTATSDTDFAFHALPKDPRPAHENVPIKSSDRAMTQEAAIEFMERLFVPCVSAAALVCVDAGHAKSVAAAANYAKFANRARRMNGAPEVPTATHMYVRLVSEAVIEAWAATCKAIGPMNTLVDVVFDRQDMNEVERQKFAERLREATDARGRGFKSGEIRWASRSDEPLLLLPDQIAGVVRRHARGSDLPEGMAAVDSWRGSAIIRIVELH